MIAKKSVCTVALLEVSEKSHRRINMKKQTRYSSRVVRVHQPHPTHRLTRPFVASNWTCFLQTYLSKAWRRCSTEQSKGILSTFRVTMPLMSGGPLPRIPGSPKKVPDVLLMVPLITSRKSGGRTEGTWADDDDDEGIARFRYLFLISRFIS